MPIFAATELLETFRPQQPIWETLLRGTVAYLGIVALMRLVLKRQSGSFGLGDALLVVLIADAAQNGMAGEGTSLFDAFLLIGVLLGWNYALDMASQRWKWARKLLESESTILVQDGRVLEENLKKEGITREELCSQLRLKGVDGPEKVREARIEGEGQISVLKRKPEDGPKGRATPTLAELDEAVAAFQLAAERLRKQIVRHERRAKRAK